VWQDAAPLALAYKFLPLDRREVAPRARVKKKKGPLLTQGALPDDRNPRPAHWLVKMVAGTIITAVVGLVVNRYIKSDSGPAQATPGQIKTRCEIAGYLHDLARYPIAEVHLLTTRDNQIVSSMTTDAEGAFFWAGACEKINSTRLRVTRGQGYCVYDTGKDVDADSLSDQNLIIDRRSLDYGPGACPQNR
jgi:hypothetical protein